MDIGPWHPYVLSRAITIECINHISLVQTTISLQPRSCTLSLFGTGIKKHFITMGSLQVAMEDIFPKDLPKQKTRNLNVFMKII